MNDQTGLHRERFTLEVWQDGICQVKPHITLTPALIEEIARAALRLIRDRHGVRGIVLDVREHSPLSIVRLSNLVDRLGEMGLPLVVLFSETRYQRVATLLHNTLAHKEHVAYATDPAQARALINATSSSSSSQLTGYLYR
ncbi:MAG: hypothetical protein KJ047_09705 [Anaerolineae bacterium]|nr:hypothetical protein [Anaerolineae bacterium]